MLEAYSISGPGYAFRLWVDFKVLVTTYKALTGMGPAYLMDHLTPQGRLPQLWSAGMLWWDPLCNKTDGVTGSAFFMRAQRFWNLLPTLGPK